MAELYKTHRPDRWEGLIGQQGVARTLRSAVLNDAVPTAYGFFGPRGCGKTSAALLLAKALNCENRQQDANPCNICTVCQNIDNGSQVGVTYRSMANQGGVDDVREMMVEARNRTVISRQVMILDEVHNLSKAAFDSMLIPLEEQSMNTLFILCSTEQDKIPQTILSRIQARKFNLVTAEEMIPHVQRVLKQEGLDLSDELVAEAVRIGRGSVRDTLTAADSILATGQAARAHGEELMEALVSRSLPQVLTAVASAVGDGADGRALAEGLFEDLRNLILYSHGADPSLCGVIPVKDPDAAVKAMCGPDGVTMVFNLLGETISRMSTGADSRVVLEIGLCSVLERLRKAEKILASR